MEIAKKARLCLLNCNLRGELCARIVDVDEEDPRLRHYDSLLTAERCASVFEQGVERGISLLCTSEFAGSLLPPSIAFWRQWIVSILSHWVLCRRVNPRSRLDIPRGLLDSWSRRARRIPEFSRLSIAFQRRLWRFLRSALLTKLEETGQTLVERLAESHPLWPVIGDLNITIAHARGNPGLPFSFALHYIDGLSTTATVSFSSVRGPIQGASHVTGFGDYLCGVLEKAAERSPTLSRLLDSQEIFAPCGLIPRDAHALLLDLPGLEEAGVHTKVPSWWEQRKPPRLASRTYLGGAPPTNSGMGGMLDVRTTYIVDDHELNRAEWCALVDESVNGLVKIRERWVELDRARIEEAMAAWRASEELRERGEVTFSEALTILDSPRENEPNDLKEPSECFVAGPWLGRARSAIRRQEILDEFAPGREFFGVLRPYQRAGVAWLAMLSELGVGALLADDMGLGKTVQVIALIAGQRRRGRASPLLLVVPASLISNWQGEFEKFAKGIAVTVAHRNFDGMDNALSADLVLTSYGTLRQHQQLRERDWDTVVLDEAQMIKNSSTKLARALKSLSAHRRVALTGTPIENHPGDLWSLMDFLNPGALGTATAFRKQWRLAQTDPRAMEELRAKVHPFMLRRRKTDPEIALELPEKVEVNAYCGLSGTQADLYSQVLVAQNWAKKAEGVERSAAVLTTIQNLKQICDHPALYLRRGNYDPGISDKFLRLQRICEQIAASGEKALIFTQFATLTVPLAEHLGQVFGRSGLIFDGKTPLNRRSEIVAEFQRDDGPPFMVLTIKVGGLGLNLTAASHVIHFDLWWNPAQETQATDRVHRIGQSRRVVIHRLICRGGIEEKIDQLLQRKRAIAEELMGADVEEKSLARMTDEELLHLFELDRARAQNTDDAGESD